MHEELWQEVATASSGVQQYHHPDQWMPHITIGFGDISKDNLSQIIPFLAERNFSWEITGELRPGKSSMKGLHWHPITSEVLEQLDRVREPIVQESNGFIFEDSSESIRQQREERTRQLLREGEE